MTDTITQLIEQIHHYEQSIKEINQELKAAKQALNNNFEQQVIEKLKDKQYGCGTATFGHDKYKIKFTVSKKVKWDQDSLKKVREQIREAGAPVDAYIKEKLEVSETLYKNFPDDIKNAFLPARTVVADKPKLSIEEV